MQNKEAELENCVSSLQLHQSATTLLAPAGFIVVVNRYQPVSGLPELTECVVCQTVVPVTVLDLADIGVNLMCLELT